MSQGPKANGDDSSGDGSSGDGSSEDGAVPEEEYKQYHVKKMEVDLHVPSDWVGWEIYMSQPSVPNLVCWWLCRL
jgi:hypothetical protein